MKPALFILTAILLAGCYRGHAEVPAPAGPVSLTDPPGRVARLSEMSGPVSFRAAGNEAWTAAELNRPLTVGDELWTDENARAELDLGHAFVRLGSHTSITMLNLDDRGVQISLLNGTLQVRLRRLEENDEFEVATPQAALTLLRVGDYRFGVEPGGGETLVTVRAGQVEAIAPDKSFTIRAQQQARLTGTDGLSYQIMPAPPIDAFDDYCRQRDRVERADSEEYVSPQVIGRSDLDRYGSWRMHVTWGPVWYPTVVTPGWAPYRYGHWVWIEPWGWTWVDDAPWGFAPFHYGRWVFVGGYWGWVPGPRHLRPVYAPALVVFAGGGPGYRYYFQIGVGIGVAWFPLGPHEIYIPPYRTSRTYITNVNISHTVIHNTTNIWSTDMTRQRYVNRNIDGAITAVSEDVFARGGHVARANVRVTPDEARNVHVGGTAPPVTPRRESTGPVADPSRPVTRPPEAISRREPTVRRTPAPSPAPFERRRPVLERNPGRPPDPADVQEMSRAQEAPRHREARPPVQQPQPPQQPGPPVVRTQPVPRAEQPAPAPTPKATENRRRTIERERQQAPAQPPRSSPRGTEPAKQPQGRRR